ncbi:MAG: hypothetical protein H0T41_14985 [Rhodobacteraceae bacterium]|nr:hypothetical protein [Paracoccaceae bacterium]
MDRAHVWAWDARPWPDFPERLETWIDGLNYDLGHWINARIALPALAEIVSDVCARSGVREVEVSELYGAATGFMIGAVETARQSLQPLMLTYGFDSFTLRERVAFAGRNGKVALELTSDMMVVSAAKPVFACSRSSPADAPGRVVLEYVRSDLDYQPGVAEAVAPQVAEADTAQSSVPVVISEAYAKVVAERWLIESRVARDSVQFELPPALLGVTSGDVVSIAKGERHDLYRVDRVEELGSRALTAVRIEPSVYDAPVYDLTPARDRPVLAQTPVHAEFLELPLLRGDEAPDAPYVAIAKTPWTGSVAVYAAPADSGYILNREILRPAIVGETLEPLRACKAGLLTRDRLRVRLSSGALQSQASLNVLNGANAAALRYGGTGAWEIVQFTTALLVGSSEYVLGGLLRGQAGTDGIMPDVWPPGTDFVLLDGGVVQVGQTSGARGLERHFRIGPATRAYDDPSYLHMIQTFGGVGLRPYRPAHLSASRRADGAVDLRWVRRTRIDGDTWDGNEVPLGEERELYRVVVRNEGNVLRKYEPTSVSQVYSASHHAEDGSHAILMFEVAQVSRQFGTGPYARVIVDF